jgi:hypothetical protein
MGVMRENRTFAAPILIAVLILTALAAPYVAGYFWLSEKGMLGDGVTVIRTYASKALAVVYWPAAFVEGCVTDCRVLTKP